MEDVADAKGSRVLREHSTTTDHVAHFTNSIEMKKLPKTTYPSSNLITVNVGATTMEDLKLQTYDIGSSPNGHVIIFNHFEFLPKLELGARNGTDLDQDKLEDLFHSIGFPKKNIFIHKDLTHFEIFEVLQKEAQADHNLHNIFICVVLTHGENGALYSKDRVFPVSHIWKEFTDDNCPSLRGKPKLFFIQACRGSKLDAGTELNFETSSQKAMDKVDGHLAAEYSNLDLRSHDSSSCKEDSQDSSDRPRTSSDPSLTLPSTFRRSRRRYSCDTSGNEQGNNSVHTAPDILVAYSTFEGFYSFRRPQDGSWFIQNLCEVMKQQYQNDDVLSILTQVNLKVAVDMISSVSNLSKKEFDKKKQIPSFSSTLTKLLYFNNQ